MPWRNNISMPLLIDGVVLALTHQLIGHPQLLFPRSSIFLFVYLPWTCFYSATTPSPLFIQGVGFIASV